MRELRKTYTIIIVTHNMQQAARVSDLTAFFTMAEDRAGYLVELGRDEPGLHQPDRAVDRGLHLGPVRMSAVRRS